LEKVVHDILTTEQGTSFYVITSANRDDFEVDDENEEQPYGENGGVFLTETSGTDGGDAKKS